MKFKIEESTVFISVVKWFVLATLVGIIVGGTVTLFLKALTFSIDLAEQYPSYFLALPIVLFLSILITQLAPDAAGHGTEKVIAAIHKNSGRIKILVVPVKLFTTIITLAAGGSVGKEGPCAQIGAGLASGFADLFRFDDYDRRKLVICGISAGFASVFGTPIAGAIFGVEVLFIGTILYDVLLPSFIAGITAYQISSAFGIKYFYHSIEIIPAFSEVYFLKVAIAGIFFGLCSIYMIDLLKVLEKISEKITIWKPLKGLIGGGLLIALTFTFSTSFLGLGLDTIESCLKGHEIVWYAFLVKVLFTAVTLSFGGSGGILTPVFFVGATSGAVFAQLLGLDIATFSSIGMVSMLAASTNTPIAASILCIELFGAKVAPFATVACVISFMVSGHRSVYPSQVLAINKTRKAQVEIGKELETLEENYEAGGSRNYILHTLRLINRRMRTTITKRGK